jgi:hypothetical protein
MANSVTIKKGKYKYAEEVAKIKPLEQFGIDTCGVSWESLFRKHLAFDVLSCGGLSCEGDKCLVNEIGKDCNC